MARTELASRLRCTCPSWRRKISRSPRRSGLGATALGWFARRHAWRRLWLFLAVLSVVVVVAPGVGRADEVDVAVEAFAAGGAMVGVTVGPTEKELVKSLVRCAVMHSTPVIECARDELIKKLPQAAQPLAKCLVGGGKTLHQCALSGAISQLPPQTQQLAQCIATNGDLGQCSKNFAMNQLNGAEQAGLNDAFATIDRLKADTASQLGAGSGTITNIIKVAEALREGDWAMVSLYGGAEVYKAAAKAILATVLTPALAPVIGPIVDTIVDSDVNLAVGLIRALKAKDDATIAQLLTEFYLTQSVQAPCALIPKGEAYDAICGNIMKGIQDAGELVGKGVHAVVTCRLLDRANAGPAGDAYKSTCGFVTRRIGEAEGVAEKAGGALLDGAGDVVHFFGRVGEGIGEGVGDGLRDVGKVANAVLKCKLPLGGAYTSACNTIGQGLGDAVQAAANLPSGVSDALNSALTGRRDDCGTDDDQYYADHYASCRYHAVVANNLKPNGFAANEASLNNLCRQHFEACSRKFGGGTSDRISATCDPLRDRFEREVAQLAGRLNEAAAAYARGYPPIQLYAEMGTSCDTGEAINRFLPDCVNALQVQFPDATQAGRCNPDGSQSLGSSGAFLNACGNAAFGNNQLATCHFKWGPDSCPGRIDPDGTCVVTNTDCPPGWTHNAGKGACERILAPPSPPRIAVPPPAISPQECPGGWTGVYPTCCHPGTAYRNGGCETLTAAPPPFAAGPVPTPGTCPRGWTGVYPTCCQPGTEYRNGRCEALTAAPPPPPFTPAPGPVPAPRVCPPGWTGIHPTCCQPGTAYRNGRCEALTAAPTPPPFAPGPVPAPRACPPGWAGVHPTCCQPGLLYQNGACVRPTAGPPSIPPASVHTCAEGMVGTHPNCACPANTRLVHAGSRTICIPVGHAPPPMPAPAAHCTGGRVGIPPNCRCPAGTTYLHERCLRVAAPPPQHTQPAQNCPVIRVCVQYGKPAPGSLVGSCVRYENQRQCSSPSNVK